MLQMNCRHNQQGRSGMGSLIVPNAMWSCLPCALLGPSLPNATMWSCLLCMIPDKQTFILSLPSVMSFGS